MGVDVLTFGCRLNAYESEVMGEQARAAGLTDIVVLNTCAVTGEAVRQARQAIRRTVRAKPGSRIVVTGCAAQTGADAFAGMEGVTAVIGNADKLDPGLWRRLADGAAPEPGISDIMAARTMEAPPVAGHRGLPRAYVPVQTGCDHRCTFCIIPFGRGPSRSLPMGAVVERVKRLAGNGAAEIVVTGVDITAYGGDLPGRATLGLLVQAILRHVPDLPRLRLSSIDSVEADEALLDAMASEARLMPHLHLSLQAGDDMILKRMKRRHSRDDAIRFCEAMRARRPDIVFGADFIAGFPTETEAMFGRTLALVEECGLTHLHVFPFSPREGTPAARMPQVDGAAIRERAARLRERGEVALGAHLDAQVGRRLSVMAEGGGLGRTEAYASVVVPETMPPGTIADLAIAASDGRRLIAAEAA